MQRWLPLCQVQSVMAACFTSVEHAAQYAIGQARFLLCETSRLGPSKANEPSVRKSQQAISCRPLSLSDGVISILETENEAAARMLLHGLTTA